MHDQLVHCFRFGNQRCTIWQLLGEFGFSCVVESSCKDGLVCRQLTSLTFLGWAMTWNFSLFVNTSSSDPHWVSSDTCFMRLRQQSVSTNQSYIKTPLCSDRMATLQVVSPIPALRKKGREKCLNNSWITLDLIQNQYSNVTMKHESLPQKPSLTWSWAVCEWMDTVNVERKPSK